MLRAAVLGAGAAAVAMMLAAPGRARAEWTTQGTERILSFRSAVTVAPDGSMRVEETIRVLSFGDRIKHGIYRDFPTRYRDRLGNQVTVDFAMDGVTVDGAPETFVTASRANGVRVTVGRATNLLARGAHTYLLSYRTDRQLGFFADHDELYWNVTGNGWPFEIDEASAEVRLPEGAASKMFGLSGFTGPAGSHGAALVAEPRGGSAVFITTRPLAPHEGLTVVVAWPKGFVRERSAAMKRADFVRDNRYTMLALGGWAILLAYLLLAWRAVGRDPRSGEIVATPTPPDGLSPAGARYLRKMKLDAVGFSAAVLSLAAKGAVLIGRDLQGVFTVSRPVSLTALRGTVSPDEEALATALFSGGGDAVRLQPTRSKVVTQAREALRKRLAADFGTRYFRRNRGHSLVGLALAALPLAAVVASASGEGRAGAAFMLLWLSFWSLGVFALGVAVASAWRAVARPRRRAGQVVAAVFTSLFATPFFGAEIFVLVMFAKVTSVLAAVVVVATAAVVVLLFRLLPAPTAEGRALLDRLAGYQKFLTGREGRVDLERPPMTLEIFDRHLAFAVALGVAGAWGDRFTEILAATAAGTSTYVPYWRDWQSDPMTDPGWAGNLTDAFSGAISSASSSSGSSSGSGGSSGGGGGGGGGGGW